MVIIISLTQLLMLIISYFINKKNLFKWIFLVNIWWGILIIANKINPYGGYRVSNNTYMLIWLFLLFLTIGYSFTKINVRINKTCDEKIFLNQYDNIILNNRIVKIIMYIITGLLIFYAIRYARYMGADNILLARTARYYVGDVFRSTIELLFFNYFVATGRFFFAFIISFGLLFGRLKNRMFVLSVINLILYSYIGGSRFPFVLLGVEILVLMLIKNQLSVQKLTSKKIWRGVLVGLCILIIVFFMLYFTAYRLGMLKYNFDFMKESIQVLYDQIIGYNTGPLSALSKSLDEGILYNHYYFGRAVILNGIDEFFSNFCSAFGIHITSARYAIGEVMSRTINIGINSFNALFTYIYWFYFDFGIIGVVIYSFVFGFLEKEVVCKFLENPSLWTLMLMVHMMYFFIMSNTTWELNAADSLVYIVILFCYIRKKEQSIFE